MTLRLLTFAQISVWSAELGLNPMKELWENDWLEGSTLCFCDGMGHCGVYKCQQAGFWEGDHVKGES